MKLMGCSFKAMFLAGAVLASGARADSPTVPQLPPVTNYAVSFTAINAVRSGSFNEIRYRAYLPGTFGVGQYGIQAMLGFPGEAAGRGGVLVELNAGCPDTLLTADVSVTGNPSAVSGYSYGSRTAYFPVEEGEQVYAVRAVLSTPNVPGSCHLTIRFRR